MATKATEKIYPLSGIYSTIAQHLTRHLHCAILDRSGNRKAQTLNKA
jgi:hypothetical protein